MDFFEYIIFVLNQFGGGAGGQENELVRFGLAAIFFAILFTLAWSRKQQGDFPREKLLLMGFGLGFVREFFMFIIKSLIISGTIQQAVLEVFFPPFEHTVRLIAVGFIAGAFLRYALDVTFISRRYLQYSTLGSICVYLVLFLPWAQAVLANPEIRFGDFWGDWVFHIWGVIILTVPLYIFLRKGGWLANTVMLAIAGFFIDDFLMLFNLGTAGAYKGIFSPIRHNAHMWGIPVLGYVYLKEMNNERQAAQNALKAEHNLLVRAEQELQKAQSYLTNMIDSMPSALIGVDAKGIVTQWNIEAQRLSGLLPDEAIGQSLAKIIPRLSAELDQVHLAMQSRKVQVHPRQSYLHNGQLHYEDVTVYPLTSNGIDGAVIRVDDVTDQVRMQEMMIQSEKMLSVGGLAAGMAHEINNPLAGLMQTADNMSNRLTNMKLPANLRAAEEAGTTIEAIQTFMKSRGILRMITTINKSGQRVAKIVDNMLSFARKGEKSITTLDITELLDNALELAATDYDLKKQYDFKTIKIVKEYSDKLPYVPCEGGQIQQVFLNILRNGAQALQESGTKNPTFILRISKDNKKNMIVIEFEDNGPGMDEAIRKRVFEPFFTTKSVGEGTGLGMSVSYFIITEIHGGTLDVVSEPGQTTNFILCLPLDRIENNQ